MCSEIAPRSGCSAWTATRVSGAASFLQAGKNAMGIIAAASKMCRVFKKTPVALMLFICSHDSCQRFKIGARGLVTHSSLFARVFRTDKGALCVDNFERGRLALSITELG